MDCPGCRRIDLHAGKCFIITAPLMYILPEWMPPAIITSILGWLSPGGVMTAKGVRANFDLIAAIAVDHLEEMIYVMESAAERIARGDAIEEIDTKEYQIYAASVSDGGGHAIACVFDAEEYFDILYCAASEVGISLEEMNELVVELPESEFGADMISGGFDAWKGVSVEMKNDPVEEILDCMSRRLKSRGVMVSSPGLSEDATVIFHLRAYSEVPKD